MEEEKKRERIVAEGRYIENGYYAPEICSFCHQCKAEGIPAPKCCEHLGCMYSPLDFEVLRSDAYTHEQRLLFFTELLKLGKISIDMCWFKDPYYGPLNVLSKRPDIDKMANDDGYLVLRARCTGRPVVDLQFFMKKGDYPCINWDLEHGCKLSQIERPAAGRLLKPVLLECEGERYCSCEQMGEEDILNHWAEHQLLMYDLYLAIRGLDIK